MTSEYKVPRILWESLESVLLANSRRFISEIAKRLDIPEKELVKHVLPTSDSLKVYIQDSQLDENKCRAYVQHDKMTILCRKPVAYGSEYCVCHRNKRMTVIDNAIIPENIQRITDKNDRDNLWINNQNHIINTKAEKIGIINKDKTKVKIYIIKP
jgi:hypothetical protein